MNVKSFILLTFLFVSIPLFAQKQQPKLPTPTPSQLRWAKAELGVVFHYDLHVFDGVR